jgi:hypothetical protein
LSLNTNTSRQAKFEKNLVESGGKRININLHKDEVEDLTLIMALEKRSQTSVIRAAIARWADQIREANK